MMEGHNFDLQFQPNIGGPSVAHACLKVAPTKLVLKDELAHSQEESSQVQACRLKIEVPSHGKVPRCASCNQGLFERWPHPKCIDFVIHVRCTIALVSENKFIQAGFGFSLLCLPDTVDPSNMIDWKTSSCEIGAEQQSRKVNMDQLGDSHHILPRHFLVAAEGNCSRAQTTS